MLAANDFTARGIAASARCLPSSYAAWRVAAVAVLALLAMAAGADPGGDQQPIVLTPGTGEYALGTSAEILEDPDRSLTLEQVLTDEVSGRFQPTPSEVPSLGFTESAYWSRVQIRNESGRSGKWILEVAYPPLENLDLYIVRDRTDIEHQQGGAHQPFAERALRHRSPVFDFHLARGETVTLYLRARTQSSLILPLTLWEPGSFAEKLGETVYAQGIYYGLIGAMIFYNLFIFITIREKTYLLYISFLVSFALYQMAIQGFWQQYLWPRSIGWDNHVLAFSGSLAILFGLLFTQSFLEIRRNHPRFHRVGLVFLALAVMSLALSVFGSYRQAIMVMSLAGGLVVLYALTVGTLSCARGYRPARYFMVAWLMLVLGTVLQMLRAFGVIPSNFMTTHSLQIGSAMEAILLALALAARIRTMKAEKEVAQQSIVDNMRRMDELKDEFLANTSHELRTPLNGMTGLAESILNNPRSRLSDEDQRNLEMIVTSGHRLNNLVNDILDFSRLQHRDLILSPRAVDVRALTDVVLILLQPLAQDKGLTLSNSVPRDLPPAEADEARLQQILHNLIGNAIKFTDDGHVGISGELQGESLCLHVSDTGRGIDSDRLDDIFDSFSQVDGSVAREHGGTGLGLAITRQMVELHGGRISVDSRPGQGATFHFTLPVASAQRAEPAGTMPSIREPIHAGDSLQAENHAAGTGDVAEPSNPTTGGRILVVDDEPINRRVLNGQLSSAGYAVVEAQDGEAALQQLHRDPGIDLILLDVMMPRLSGYDVCRELRAHWSPEQLPIIFLTARAQDQDVIAAFRGGANDYLSKPFSGDELLARVALHLDLSRKYHDLAARNRELQELTQTNASLEEISLTDALTGLKNRRFFSARLDEEWQRCQRTGQPLSLLIMDIDHFKAFNDTHGHVAGDECLKVIAQTLRNAVARPYDRVCRYGGEEFVVILSNTSGDGAWTVAERIRGDVEATPIPVEDGTQWVTLSIGAAVGHPRNDTTAQQLILQADDALYLAKEYGRNRVVFAPGAET